MVLASELWPKWVFREKKAADFALSENGIIAGVVRQAAAYFYLFWGNEALFIRHVMTFWNFYLLGW